MSDGRCRACGAVLAPNATWCSLCFADLRPPAPAPVKEPAAMAAAATQPWTAAETVATAPLAQAPVAVPAEHPAGDPLGAPDPLGPPDPLEALEKAAAEVATPAAPSPTWPCPQCGAKVAMDLDFCNECGAGFLAGVANGQSVRLPVIGEVKSMSSSQRLMMGVGVALALMALIVALAFIGGHLFG